MLISFRLDQINHQPADYLSHQTATDLIKTSPYSVNLNVERQIPITILTPPYSPQTNYTPVPMYSTTQNNSFSPTGSSLSGGSLYRPQHLCSTNQGKCSLGVFILPKINDDKTAIV